MMKPDQSGCSFNEKRLKVSDANLVSVSHWWKLDIQGIIFCRLSCSSISMFKKILFALSFALILGVDVEAKEFAECRQLFPKGQIPLVPNQAALQLRDLCFSSFAVMHSGRSRTPLYVVERLNKDILIAAKSNQRSTKFYAEARLPVEERAELADYKHSGFDRGHMASAGDMDTSEAMAQSFSLSNMVPQAPINNRKAWSSIETATRKYVMRAQGDVFVMTGPVFGQAPKTVNSGRMWVPDYLFKLVYDPNTGRSWAHWIENTDEARPRKPISYAELVSRTGIQFLPN